MSNEKYPRNELWVRKTYEALVMNGSLTTFFRPGDRVTPTEKYFIEGEVLTLKFLEKPGDEARGFVPIINGNSKKARVVSLNKKNIEDFVDEDFEGSSPDVKNTTQLKYNLGIIYNKPIDEIKEVTRINVEYVE
tara:strand:- start:227 stop:628 length:402 start_codon:yes stop_codon:yes gene_type:complete